mgnify:CR=1 FL=1
MAKITVQKTDVTILKINDTDYISLTDMANAKESESRAADIIKNWLRNRYTLEFLGTWEMVHNPHFKVVEFDHFKSEAGLPSFVLSVSEWIEKTDAIGVIVKKGKYGGTYAHKDIAFEFGSAISVPFKIYLIEEFQRLKEQEQTQIGWSAKRELSKINYRIHTDAIRQNLIPNHLNISRVTFSIDKMGQFMVFPDFSGGLFPYFRGKYHFLRGEAAVIACTQQNQACLLYTSPSPRDCS